MTSFAHKESPMLIGVVRRETVRDAIADIKNCEVHGATGIDLHLSCLKRELWNEESLRTIISSTKLPILSLHYNHNYDYSLFESTEEERVALLMTAVRAGTSAIDMQGYTFDQASKAGVREEFKDAPLSFLKNNPHEVVLDPKIIEKQCALIEEVHSLGSEVLISTHTGIQMKAEEVVELAQFLEKRNPDVIKIVSVSKDEEDLAEAIRAALLLKKEVRTVVHYHAAGAPARLSRILNPLLNGYLIFCHDGYHAGANFEQLDLETAKTAVDALKKLM